jgi:transcriptional regulator EpsA
MQMPDRELSLTIPLREAEGLVRLIEAAPGVRRRYQFFVWMQTHVHLLLPHVVAVCGAYRRQIKGLAFEVFHGVVIPEPVLAELGHAGSPAMQLVAERWVAQGGGPTVLPLQALCEHANAAVAEVWRALSDAGMGHLLVHGVSRPDRPSEIESLFILAGAGERPAATRTYHLELLIPHLHAVFLRVLTTERELGALPVRPRPLAPAQDAQRWHVTDRERQILFWVREGKSNQQIGEQLGISALTVKNHVQKILRKMGASNRAQAVSLAITAHLLKDMKASDAP